MEGVLTSAVKSDCTRETKVTSVSGSQKAGQCGQSRKHIRELMKMAIDKYLIIVLFFICNLAVAFTDTPAACYRLEPQTVVGIIFADVLLTLIIVVITYHCGSFRRQKTENAHKVYMNVRANCKR
ncbi:hypothetical protein JOB18_010636 [Solea senegalensis]|uniref:Hematopoietic cell signal transducer n=1 Tax=Solea senegalensis TaxID=28829 RepID=A0AAV6PTG7_SOLSE|nr:hematopoietic cell signal transducer [Solea senegalensis]KAG7474515.1 hematopoietic cell signal transducer-like [Solea senegalensis]KAG7474516.1 hypothetical protein JOB18_010636 [Solea senegalensis]